MATPREILDTKCEELVLEKFFNEFVVRWYQEKAISAPQYDKAKKKIEDLKDKRTKGKKTIQARITEPFKGDEDDVRNLPDSILKGSKVNLQERPPLAMFRVSVSSSQSRITQSNSIVTKVNDKEQTYRKEEVDLQRLLLESYDTRRILEEIKDEMSKARADAYVELREKEQQLERLRKALENSVEQVNTLTLRLCKLAGDKLQQENSEMADLSDPNRPTELGTRYSKGTSTKIQCRWKTKRAILTDTPEKKRTILTDTPEKKRAILTDTPEKRRAILTNTPEKKRAILTDTPEKKRAILSDTPEKKRAILSVTPEKKREILTDTPEKKRAILTDTPEKKRAILTDTPEKKSLEQRQLRKCSITGANKVKKERENQRKKVKHTKSLENLSSEEE